MPKEMNNESKAYQTVCKRMEEVVPAYIARYVQWYLTDPSERRSWEELCATDKSMLDSFGNPRTEEYARDNWLKREDTQRAIQIYMKYMKTYNSMRIYQAMMEKALKGDVNAAKYIEQFHSSDFFDEGSDEIDAFLNKVNIPKLKKDRGAQGK
ncbi:MAG: hypothetical protein LUD12_16065 [Lachnospiraceae bacterium]|nr:hypothetical protein [Lachnospiraceae bacterium]